MKTQEKAEGFGYLNLTPALLWGSSVGVGSLLSFRASGRKPRWPGRGEGQIRVAGGKLLESKRSGAGVGRVNSRSTEASPVGGLDGQHRKHWERGVLTGAGTRPEEG